MAGGVKAYTTASGKRVRGYQRGQGTNGLRHSPPSPGARSFVAKGRFNAGGRAAASQAPKPNDKYAMQPGYGGYNPYYFQNPKMRPGGG